MTTFTVVHVMISFVALAAGFAVLLGILMRKEPRMWNDLFLATTVATSVGGFGFPADRILPSHVLAVLSLVVLAVSIYAYYFAGPSGPWTKVYTATATIAQYFNFFVLIVQAFQKVPFLHDLAPTQSEFPFAAAQLAALVGFIAVGYFATLRSPSEVEQIA